MDTPIGIRSKQRFNPFVNPGFAPIDLLTPTNQTDHHGPITMAIKTRNQKLRLRSIKVRPALLAKHEARRFRKVPCTLRLIEKSDVLDRSPRLILKTIVSKVMDILNE